MAESNQHAALVQIIISYIKREHAEVTALGIVDDLSNAIGAEKPNRIEGFVPDVYAFDAPRTTTIIGEAKTKDDLETEHSKKQVAAFLSHLRYQDAGIFIMAVPWQLKRRAQSIVSRLQKAAEAASVTVVTLDDLCL